MIKSHAKILTYLRFRASTAKELASQIDKAQSNLTKTLNTLERKKLVNHDGGFPKIWSVTDYALELLDESPLFGATIKFPSLPTDQIKSLMKKDARLREGILEIDWSSTEVRSAAQRAIKQKLENEEFATGLMLFHMYHSIAVGQENVRQAFWNDIEFIDEITKLQQTNSDED